MSEDLMGNIVSLCKRRGFIFQGSEIYGGFTGFWDYGPLGVELKNNVKREWWKTMVYNREDVVGMDAAIIMNPKVWEASGHTASFTDPLVECKSCHKRFRVDNLAFDENNLESVRKEAMIEGYKAFQKAIDFRVASQKILDVIDAYLKSKNVVLITPEEKILLQEEIDPFLEEVKNQLSKSREELGFYDWMNRQVSLSKAGLGAVYGVFLNRFVFCPNCGKIDWVEPKTFNLLTEVYLGVTEPKEKAYLRGEITQGVFVNFQNVVNSTRIKIPFGIAQIGKAFRNEITPGNFTFRSREFEQMELEYFVEPDEKESEKTFNFWKDLRIKWYESLGISKEKLKFHDHEPDKRAHYARYATDIDYNAPFGWSEFEGIHHRGDFDLKNHKLSYKDPDTQKEYIPWVIETSGGVDRAALFFLIDAYCEDEKRVVLRLNPKLAPYKVAVFPLLANRPELVNKARKIYEDLHRCFNVAWDDRGNIGKRYFAQDEIGTPWCVTVDFETLEKDTVTVRNRDTMAQERRKVGELKEWFEQQLEKK